MMSYIIIGVYMILTVSAVVLIKLGSSKETLISVSNGMFSFQISFISLLGLLCYVCSFLLYMFLLSNFDLTYIVPVTTGITQVATIILAIIIFKESFTISKAFGIALVLIGVTIISYKK